MNLHFMHLDALHLPPATAASVIMMSRQNEAAVPPIESFFTPIPLRSNSVTVKRTYLFSYSFEQINQQLDKRDHQLRLSQQQQHQQQQPPQQQYYAAGIPVDKDVNEIQRNSLSSANSRKSPNILYHTFLNPESTYFMGQLPRRKRTEDQQHQHQQQSIYKFSIYRGNNSQLIREIISMKSNWVEAPLTTTAKKNSNNNTSHSSTKSPTTDVHFIWSPVSSGIIFEGVKSSLSHRICVNHVERHCELSSKALLIKNLTRICIVEHLPVFEVTPLTFCISYTSDNMHFEKQFETFLSTFLSHSTNLQADSVAAALLRSKNYYAGLSRHVTGRSPIQFSSFGVGGTAFNTTLNKSHYNNASSTPQQAGAISATSTNPTIPTTSSSSSSLFSGLNLWIIKPADFNRGRGIRLFSSLVQLNKILQEYAEIGKGSSSSSSSRVNSSIGPLTSAISPKILTHLTSQYVIQKYIEKPLLIDNRKFDIRMWVLISHDNKYFVCREGYIRTACEKYSTSESSISNAVVHLTNNAIQKNAAGYGRLEDGNQLSFARFEAYLKSQNSSITCDFRGSVLPRIKESIALSLDAVKAKLNPLDRKFCFEILGYDFMIDAAGQPWLIEVSTNPCIEQSSAMLDKLLKRMLDDAFKLTLDKLFPVVNSGSGTPQASMSKQVVYPVDHVSNQDSIWEQLFLGHYPLIRSHRQHR